MHELTVRILVGLGGPYLEISGRGPATGDHYVLLYRGQRQGGLEAAAAAQDVLESLATELFNIAPLVTLEGL